MNYIHHNYFSARLTPEEEAIRDEFETILNCLADELKDDNFKGSELIDVIEGIIGDIDYVFNAVEEGIYSD